jgi:hypothetical protein
VRGGKVVGNGSEVDELVCEVFKAVDVGEVRRQSE